MYLDPAVVRRALGTPGEEAEAFRALLGGGNASLPPANASLPPFAAATGALGLVELIDWEGSQPGERSGREGEGAPERRSPPVLAAARLAARTLRVLPLTAYDVFLAADLARIYPGLPSRAALHVAIMLNNGELELVSDDTAFDQVSEIRRIPPVQVAKILARRAGAAAP